MDSKLIYWHYCDVTVYINEGELYTVIQFYIVHLFPFNLYTETKYKKFQKVLESKEFSILERYAGSIVPNSCKSGLVTKKKKKVHLQILIRIFVDWIIRWSLDQSISKFGQLQI